MRRVVLDASVVVKWLRHEEGHGQRAAADLEAAYRRGAIQVSVPYLLFLELLNVAARRWGWPAERLLETAEWLAKLEFEVRDPSPGRVARWTGRGLTAYDACYVALAEEQKARLVTADERILAVAGDLVEPLARR